MRWFVVRPGGRAEQEQEYFEQLRDQHADTPQARLAALLTEGSPSLAALRDLERDFDDPPEEISFYIAFLLVADEEAQVEEAIDRIRQVLTTYGSSIDALHVAALAYHRAGDRAQRDAYLGQLLQRAPANDQRRAGWTQLRDLPAGGS